MGDQARGSAIWPRSTGLGLGCVEPPEMSVAVWRHLARASGSGAVAPVPDSTLRWRHHRGPGLAGRSSRSPPPLPFSPSGAGATTFRAHRQHHSKVIRVARSVDDRITYRGAIDYTHTDSYQEPTGCVDADGNPVDADAQTYFHGVIKWDLNLRRPRHSPAACPARPRSARDG